MKNISKLTLIFVFSFVIIYFNLSIKASDDYYDEKDLDNGILDVHDYYIAHYGERYTYNKIMFSDDFFLLAGSYRSGRLNEDLNVRGYSPYISYNVGEEMIWDREFYEYGIGEMLSVCYDDSGVYGVGYTYDYHENINMVIVKMSYEGRKVGGLKIETDNETKGYEICILDDYLFVIGFSYATNLLSYKTLNNKGTIFVMKLSLDLEILDTYYFGYVGGYNEYISATYNNELMYINCYLDRGDYYKEGYAVIRVNSHLDEVGIDYYENNNYEMIKCFDGVGLIKYDKKTNFLELRKYDWLFNYKGSYFYEIPKINSEVINFKTNSFLDCGNNLVVGFNITRNYKNYFSFGIIDKDYKLISKFEYEKDNINYIDSIHFSNNEMFVFDRKTNNQYFHVSKIKYINKIEDNLYYNGLSCEKEIETCNDTYFGTYVLNVYYRYKDEEFKTTYTKIIEPDFSVSNGSIYDINHLLTFNGKGYLNNNEIDNGYVITEPGVYTLKVIGNNGEIRLVSFSVEELCTKLDIVNNDNDFVQIESVAKKSESSKNKVSLYEDSSLITVDNKTNYIILIIIISVTCFIVGLFIPLFKKGKKHEN